jgi:DNA-binding response OmpR family regulator
MHGEIAMPNVTGTGRDAVRALLVENHKGLSQGLKRGLESQGFAVDLAKDGAEAGRKAQRAHYDVILLDLTSPNLDGLTLLQRWRKDDMQTRILVLAGKPGGEEIVPAPADESSICVHDLEINSLARSVRRAGVVVPLTTREFDLLEILARQRGQVVSRSAICKHLYNGDQEASSNVVDVYIRYLRRKIDNGSGKSLIITCWGKGYMLRDDDE